MGGRQTFRNPLFISAIMSNVSWFTPESMFNLVCSDFVFYSNVTLVRLKFKMLKELLRRKEKIVIGLKIF